MKINLIKFKFLVIKTESYKIYTFKRIAPKFIYYNIALRKKTRIIYTKGGVDWITVGCLEDMKCKAAKAFDSHLRWQLCNCTCILYIMYLHNSVTLWSWRRHAPVFPQHFWGLFCRCLCAAILIAPSNHFLVIIRATGLNHWCNWK